MAKLVECVPNFSEGRNRTVIDAIASAISAVGGVKLLDVDPGADTNRTVYTFVGRPDDVVEAAFRAAARASELIDMSAHRGAHPRIGAMDVCPFVPVSDVTMDECVALAHALGTRLGDELQVPVYFYEYAASRETRRSLAGIRVGEYEGLERKLQDPEWRPDRGPAAFNPRFGAAVVGARDFLIAYNVNLNTRDRRLANEVALNIREAGRLERDGSGNVVRDAHGQEVRRPGRLKAVRAIGWYIEEYRQAQVSINLLNYKVSPLHLVFETVCDEAARVGLRVTGSELVGLIPLEPLVEAGRFYLRRQIKSAGVPERELVEMAVRTLGLDQLGAFDAAKKVIEYHFAPPAPLADLAVARFVDEVSSESPAPGGGSVAALAGSLAAALSAMVANLTVGRKGYETHWEELSGLATCAQELKARLTRNIDADSAAFNRVMDAMRLPKGTPEQQADRTAAVERANQEAAQVPLETARLSLGALRLAERVAAIGNRNSASDAGVAALAAWAAVEGAALNVLTNLPGIAEEASKTRYREEASRLVIEASEIGRRVVDAVRAGIAD
jgi:glutamate formiminotransferase/formiminotetrahydrofolate cyclodeaminase